MDIKKSMLPIAGRESRILILGTMPGEKSLELQQYYGNRGNHFWKLLFDVFETPFSYDYADRLQLLSRHGIALWDVLESCERHGSLDSNIKSEIPNDFETFFQQHPHIRTVFFSSKGVEKYFDKYVGRKPYHTYVLLPSPSGANASMAYAGKLEKWRQLRDG